MDRLHGVMKTLGVQTKSRRRPLDHLGVFREFLTHLGQVKRAAPTKAMRTKPPRKPVRRTRKG